MTMAAAGTKRLLDVAWLRAHRNLRSTQLLAAAKALLVEQVNLSLERCGVLAGSHSRLAQSAVPVYQALDRSQNCDDLVAAFALLQRWIQVIPSEVGAGRGDQVSVRTTCRVAADTPSRQAGSHACTLARLHACMHACV